MKTIETKIIDAEIIEELKDDPRFLELAADLVEKISRPFDRLPGGQRYAEKCRAAAVTIREVDGEIEAVKPVAERIEKKIRQYVNLNPEREPLPR